MTKLLVTGGLGFIGSNFILNVLKKHADFTILNVDSETIGSNHESLSEINSSENYTFVKGDITDSTLMNDLISGCDVIVNFAAESHVDRSISDAKPFIDSNILGVFTILEILKKHKKKFLQISTDEVFGSINSGSATENFKLNPSSPYSSSKGAAELLVNSYVVDAFITRCTNNFGPRQFPEKLIPKTILLANQNKKIPIYGSGKSIRDWIFVDDHCNALMKIIFGGQPGESYNISAYNEYDNLTVVKKILAIMDKPDDLLNFVQSRPGEDIRYSMDSSKTRSNFHWKPEVNFEEGIQNTVDWYLKNKAWWQNLDSKSLSSIYS
jgi:dTDP-glucose 4,6-dehydratase